MHGVSLVGRKAYCHKHWPKNYTLATHSLLTRYLCQRSDELTYKYSTSVSPMLTLLRPPIPARGHFFSIMRNDAERQFVRLIFDASGKYASWDPEVPIEVGDYGRITSGNKGFWFWRRRKGIFLKEGNIYKDGKAKDFEIPSPNEHGVQADGTGVAWIVSKNAVKIDFDVNLSTCVDL